MSFAALCFVLAFAVLAQGAFAYDKEDFPLVGVCLGLTGAGIIIVTILSIFRPAEVQHCGEPSVDHENEPAVADSEQKEVVV